MTFFVEEVLGMAGETPDYRTVELQDANGNVRVAYICDLCGQERRPGDWPDCRSTGNHLPGNFGEEPLESYVDKNLDVVPQEITTRAQRRKIMGKNNLEYVPKLPRRGAVTYFDMKK